MSQQNFLNQCQECGQNDVVSYESAHHICSDCIERLEAKADFFNELAEIQMSRIAENDSASEGYTWRQVRQPSKQTEIG